MLKDRTRGFEDMTKTLCDNLKEVEIEALVMDDVKYKTNNQIINNTMKSKMNRTDDITSYTKGKS